MSGSNKSLILTDEDIRRSGYRVDPFDADGRYVGAPLVRVACQICFQHAPPRTPSRGGRSRASTHRVRDASRFEPALVATRIARHLLTARPFPQPPHELPHARGSPRAPNPGLGLVFDAALKKTADP
jgi:hypothetical protein